MYPRSPDQYIKTGSDRIGSVYRKAVYAQFTDATFTQEVRKPASLGLVGPVLRAEVGDTMEIVYLNNASREYSMHPHGVKYLKEHEGRETVALTLVPCRPNRLGEQWADQYMWCYRLQCTLVFSVSI